MIARVEKPVALACVFTWIGLVSGISFLEAWLKFRAPGVTLPIGLGIGRLVFSALNKIEWACATIVVVSAVWKHTTLFTLQNLMLVIVVAILLTQTVWLLPALDARAGLYIRGQSAPPSPLHVYFIAAEGLKICTLLAFGISLFRRV